MKLRTFIFWILAPLMLISIISYSTSFISSGKDRSLFKSGPGSVVGKSNNPLKNYITKQFRWDLKSDKTIITELNLPTEEVKKEMDRFGINIKIKNPAYILKRGFYLTKEGLLINYKKVFRNSASVFNKISPVVTYSADLKKNEDPLVCLLKFVQAIKYKIPPKFMGGKYIMEFLPPLNSLVLKYGDCDTKSVLLADLLEGTSFRKEKMVVVILKGFGIFHAILAVERAPLPGMLSFYIDRMGPFIPLETTDKGWMPGFTNKQVLLCLQNGRFSFVKLF